MKKEFKSIFIALTAVLAVITAQICMISAFDDDTHISRYDINAVVSDNGDMFVTEEMTFFVGNDISGFTWDKSTSKCAGISDYRVFVNGSEYAMTEYADNGDSGVYTVESHNSIDNMKIYCPSEYDDKRVIKISYTVSEAAVRYSDTAELYWQFIGSEWKMPIGDVTVRVELPKSAAGDDLQIFGHGTISGEISKENNIVTATVPETGNGDFVELRLLFNESALPLADTVNEQHLDSAKQEELEWAKDTDRQRNLSKIKLSIGAVLAVISLGISVAIAVLTYFKRDKELKPTQTFDYYRELPSNTPPTEVGYLINGGTITNECITATLLDLVRRKYITMEPGDDDKDFKFKLIASEESKKSLTAHEQQLLNWLFKHDGTFSTKEFKKEAKRQFSAEQIQKGYEKWKANAESAGKSHNYFVKNSSVLSIVPALFALLSSFIISFVLFKEDETAIIASIVLSLIGIISTVYCFLAKHKTQDAMDEYTKWMAFKRFLKHFSNMDEAVPQSLVIWEHYMIYAIVLGVANEVSKQLKVIIPAEQYNDPSLTFFGMHMYMNTRFYGDIGRINSAVSQSISSSISSAITAANSTMSSTGSGGGFSSGGGFGGGGGGGGTF